MAKITNLILRGCANDVPDDLFTQLTKETTNTEILERRLTELLRLGLSAGKLPTDVYHFHPRDLEWTEEFRLEGSKNVGLTAIGRTTVKLLQLNTPERLAERQRINPTII